MKNVSWTTSKIFPTRRFFKVNNKWRRSVVFIVKLEHISHIVLVFLLLTCKRKNYSAKYLWSLLNSPNLIFQKVSSVIPGEWDLWHKIPYVGSRTEIPIYSSGTLDPYNRTQNLWPKIFRTGDPSFYFTRNSSNLSVTYTL